METGCVKFYKKGEGWGFIVPDNGQPDVFIHACDLRKSGLLGHIQIESGMRIAFRRNKSRDKDGHENGERAVDIYILGAL